MEPSSRGEAGPDGAATPTLEETRSLETLVRKCQIVGRERKIHPLMTEFLLPGRRSLKNRVPSVSFCPILPHASVPPVPFRPNLFSATRAGSSIRITLHSSIL